MNRVRVVFLLIAVGVAVASWALTFGAWRLSKVVEGVAPLDPVRFAGLSLVALGTGGAYENPQRRGPATAVGHSSEVLLVDAGRGVAESLRFAGIPVSQPSVVLLTNLLAENTVGLDDLLLSGWLDGRSAPLRVLGPAGTKSLTASLEGAHAATVRARAEALSLPEAGARFDASEIDGDFVEELGPIAVRAGALPGGPVPALAYRFEADGRSLVVAGTGWAPDALVDLARGAELLAHEAVSPMTPDLGAELGLEEGEARRLERESSLHTSIEGVGALARRAGVGTLVLVRLRPPPVMDLQLTSIVSKSFDGRIVIPDDGERIRW